MKTCKLILVSLVLLSPVPALAQADPAAVVKTYADIALAGYEDSLTTAKNLDIAIDAFVIAPSADTLAAGPGNGRRDRPRAQPC